MAAQHQRGQLRHAFRRARVPAGRRRLGAQVHPVKAVGRQRQQVGQLADRGKRRAAQHFHRHAAVEGLQRQFDRLGGVGQVGHAQDGGVAPLPQVGQDLAVAGLDEAQRAAAEGVGLAALRQHAAGPVQQRVRVALLGLDVDGLVAIQRPHQHRQRQPFGVGAREAAVAVGRPLHRRAHAVAVAQVHVVAHAQFVAVVQHRRAGHRQEQAVHQFDPPPVAFQQRRQAAADAQVDASARIGRVDAPEVVAFAAGDHLQCQFVVVAQEDGPLAGGGNVGRLPDDVGDGKAVFLRDRHVHARHQREVERHVAFVAIAEILLRVLGPLVGLGQQQAARILAVDHGADALEHLVGLGQVLVVGALAFDQVGHGVQPQAVHAHVQPVAHHRQHFLEHLRVVVVQVGLVRVEAVPEVGVGHRVPGPVGLLGVAEDHAGAGVGLVVVRPHVEIARRRAGPRGARPLEPRMLVGGMVDHQLGDDAQAARVGRSDQLAHVGDRAVVRVHAAVVGDVVAVVASRRGVEGQQPDRIDAQVGDVVELGNQPGQIAHAVVVGIEERLHMQLVDHRVLVPKAVVLGVGLADHGHGLPGGVSHDATAARCDRVGRGTTPPRARRARFRAGRPAGPRPPGRPARAARTTRRAARPGPSGDGTDPG